MLRRKEPERFTLVDDAVARSGTRPISEVTKGREKKVGKAGPCDRLSS